MSVMTRHSVHVRLTYLLTGSRIGTTISIKDISLIQAIVVTNTFGIELIKHLCVRSQTRQAVVAEQAEGKGGHGKCTNFYKYSPCLRWVD